MTIAKCTSLQVAESFTRVWKHLQGAKRTLTSYRGPEMSKQIKAKR